MASDVLDLILSVIPGGAVGPLAIDVGLLCTYEEASGGGYERQSVHANDWQGPIDRGASKILTTEVAFPESSSAYDDPVVRGFFLTLGGKTLLSKSFTSPMYVDRPRLVPIITPTWAIRRI